MLTEDDNWKKEKEVVTKNSTKNRGLLIKHLDLDDALIQNNMFGKTARQQIQLPVIRRMKTIVDQLSTGGTGTLKKSVCESLTGSKKRSVFTAEESAQERRGDVPQLRELNRHIVPVYASVWKDLGLELEIPMYTLNAIAVDHVNHPSWSTECCKVMLQKWIRMSPRPTWARLQEALEHLSDPLHDSCKTFFSKPNGIQESQGHIPLDAIIKILQVRYIRDFTSDEGEAPVKYIELALVKDEKVTRVDKNLEEFTKLTIQGQVDEILQRKEPLGDLKNIFCYQDKPCPRLILIKGGPGIGKTTLANEICVRWSNNAEFLTKKFDAVILIPLRTVQQQSLEEAIIAYIGETAYQQLKKQLGRRCLLILEGLDEMAAERRKTDPVLSSLVKNESMLELTLLITSRPHACQGLNANRTIEVVGFSKGKIEEYVKSELPNDTQAVDSFIQQLEANSHIRSMCYIPLSLKMIIQIFQYNNSLPSTMTELYRLFIVMTLQREQEKKNTESKPFYFAQDLYNAEKILHEILPDIPEEAKKTVFLLSKLAYHAFFDWCSVRKEENKYLRTIQYKDPKVIFTENDLIQSGITLPKDSDGLGLMKCSNIKHLTSQSKTYNFMHLSMQEFLCALYIVMTFSLEDQYQLIQRHFDDHPNIMILLYGLTGLKCAKFSRYIFFKLLSGTDELGAYNDHVLATVKCICESESSISSKMSSFLTVILNHVILTPYDLVCASHLLCKYPVVTLKLAGCDIGDQGISILAQWCVKQSTQLQELHINANHLTSAGMVDVAKIIRSSPLFKTLYIGDNDIGDVGMELICKELLNNNTVTTLRAFRCGMSAKGSSCVKTLLENNTALKILSVGGNQVGNDGAATIFEGLQQNSTLTEFRIWRCGLTKDGANSIKTLLMKNTTLKMLTISCNDLSNAGIATISEAFQLNTTLTELRMHKCGLSEGGAFCIKTLLTNKTLEVLDIGGNEIGKPGVAAITEGIQYTTTLEKISIDRCGLSVEDTHQILRAAVDNAVMHVLIDNEHMKDNKVKEILSALQKKRKHMAGSVIL